QAISDTKMRLMAETNCDDEAMRCGFEWRRYDAPDGMPSSSACCAVYNGYLMGTLSNLTPNVYYKYRPYYKADSGRKYYGNWVAFLTADAAVFFEPEVHTFEAQEVTEQKAKVRGYVLAGSDDIIEQGFEYWSNTGNHLMQVSSGMLMSTTINNLTEETDYYYRSYVKTDKKTLYGEELSFRTLAKGVVGVNDQMIPQVNSETIYDLTGRKVDHLIKRRLYIRNGKKFIAR
ncbi:MAG: leucine-rich repeat domain-containing protein, partial [Prevotella sp.]|nr:leucine-rich repeat domain-containing protein [Prevotella sp.]